MRFEDPRLQGALTEWRKLRDIGDRSTADNFWFEQRVSVLRQKAFEQDKIGAAGQTSLRKAHADYWSEFVRVDDGIPHTFEPSLSPAALGPIDESDRYVRIESLIRPLAKYDITFQRLQEAFQNNEGAMIDAFLATWNASSARDYRPVFAAPLDEVREDLARADWPDRLRDRLGLAHYDCADGPIPIALMEYSVAEVRATASKLGVVDPFTAPTVLDSGPWPFFFPAPPELPCGRTMALYEVVDDAQLLAEVLHFRISYRREHIVRLDEIRTRTKVVDLRGLRNHHLLALHVAVGRDDYGEEIPE